MTARNVGTRKRKIRNPSYVRASISFPAALYGGLVKLAKQNKVSLAWIVREAAEKYIAARAIPGRQG
jgi:hypothetical protein